MSGEKGGFWLKVFLSHRKILDKEEVKSNKEKRSTKRRFCGRNIAFICEKYSPDCLSCIWNRLKRMSKYFIFAMHY